MASRAEAKTKKEKAEEFQLKANIYNRSRFEILQPAPPEPLSPISQFPEMASSSEPPMKKQKKKPSEMTLLELLDYDPQEDIEIEVKKQSEQQKQSEMKKQSEKKEQSEMKEPSETALLKLIDCPVWAKTFDEAEALDSVCRQDEAWFDSQMSQTY